MKRRSLTITAALFCFCSILLSGCGTEVNRRTFVEIMGIEMQDDAYRVSLQLYRPHDSAGNFDLTAPFERVLTGEGITVSSAIADAELRQGKELFLGHIKLIVAGNALNPSKDLEMLLSEGISPGCPVIYSDSPYNVIASSISRGGESGGGELLELMDSSIRRGQTVYTSIMKLSGDNKLLNLPCVLPLLETYPLAENTEAEGEKARFNGLTFAESNAIANGNIHPDDVAGVKLLMDDYKKRDKVTIPVTINGKTAATVITNAKTSKTAEITDDGSLRVRALIKAKVRIIENPYGLDDALIEEAVRRNLHDMVISAYSTAVWYNKNDVFGIYKLLRRHSPEQLEYYQANPQSLLAESILDIEVKNV
ncbi:MAG: hypothetical protein FWG90_01415 [Oscillospiraceae bacterium]|nr:hypothetical protein [Oscillospiraceae bacterium]